VIFCILGVVALVAAMTLLFSFTEEGFIKWLESQSHHSSNPIPMLASVFAGPVLFFGVRIFVILLLVISGLCFYAGSQ